MAKLVTKGNLAIFQFPPNDKPRFDIDENGAIFVHGYKMDFFGKEVRVSKRFELNLIGYTLISTYPDALSYIKEDNKGEIETIINESDIDRSCALVLIKQIKTWTK